MISLFLAGGAVRDMLLGRAVRDMDFAFCGSEEEFVQCFPKARKTNEHPPTGVSNGMEFCPLEGGNPDRDLLRRDLTINAMLMDEDGRLLSHPQALTDLQTVFCALPRHGLFLQTPHEYIVWPVWRRSCRNFSPTEEALEQMREVAGQGMLERSSSGKSWGGVAESSCRASAVTFSLHAGKRKLPSPWFAELAGSSDIPAGPAPWHDNSVLEHTCDVMDSIAGQTLLPSERKKIAVWMGLCHDLGKTDTDRNLLPHHYGHESRGKRAAYALGMRLKLPRLFIRAGALAARLHMKAGMLEKLRPATLRDIVWEAYSKGFHKEFWALAGADSGKALQDKADSALKSILSVRLPPEKKGLGEASGMYLRELQCQRLARDREKTLSRNKAMRAVL